MFKRPRIKLPATFVLAIAVTLCITTLSNKALAQQPTAEKDLQSKADKNEKVHSRNFQSFTIGTIPDTLAETTGDITVTSPDDIEPAIGKFLDTPSYPPVTLVDLACFSDAVVLATPVAGVSHMTADKTFIYSDWTMHVGEVLQDTPKAPIGGSETITVVRPGGKLVIDGRTVYGKAIDFPEFLPGGKYLLFLTYIPETGAFKARTKRSFNLVLDKQSAKRPQPYADLRSLSGPVPSASPEELVTDARAAIVYAHTSGKPNCAMLRGDR
jgi:hypothetical protein